MKQFSEVEKETKKIYVSQHKKYMEDEELFKRHYGVAVNPSSYGVDGGFFKGKHVLDAGCGNSAYFQKAMFDLGVAHVTCIDIGDTWIPELKNALNILGVPEDFCDMVPASVSNLPFEDYRFDFIASNGVLMHLDGLSEAALAFSEMSRVLKSSGALYVYVGVENPGIVDKYILPALRNAYVIEPEFRSYIDGLTPAEIQQSIKSYCELAEKNDNSINVKAIVDNLDLITLGFVTFIHNALQVPIQQGPNLGLAWANEQFIKNGFTSFDRVPDVYWMRNDVRKFLSPAHYDLANPLSKIFYGGGHLKMMGIKS